jgi:hypothetical protein
MRGNVRMKFGRLVSSSRAFRIDQIDRFRPISPVNTLPLQTVSMMCRRVTVAGARSRRMQRTCQAFSCSTVVRPSTVTARHFSSSCSFGLFIRVPPYLIASRLDQKTRKELRRNACPNSLSPDLVFVAGFDRESLECTLSTCRLISP